MAHRSRAGDAESTHRTHLELKSKSVHLVLLTSENVWVEKRLNTAKSLQQCGSHARSKSLELDRFAMNLLHLHKFWHIVTVYMYLREDIEQIQQHASRCIERLRLFSIETTCCSECVSTNVDEAIDHESSVVGISGDLLATDESTPTVEDKEDDANEAGTSKSPEKKLKETNTSSSRALVKRGPTEIMEAPSTSTRKDETLSTIHPRLVGISGTTSATANRDDEHISHTAAMNTQQHDDDDDDDEDELMVRWYISMSSVEE